MITNLTLQLWGTPSHSVKIFDTFVTKPHLLVLLQALGPNCKQDQLCFSRYFFMPYSLFSVFIWIMQSRNQYKGSEQFKGETYTSHLTSF